MTNDQLFHGIVKTSARWLQNETSACEQHFATWQECKIQLLQENESEETGKPRNIGIYGQSRVVAEKTRKTVMKCLPTQI